MESKNLMEDEKINNQDDLKDEEKLDKTQNQECTNEGENQQKKKKKKKNKKKKKGPNY